MTAGRKIRLHVEMLERRELKEGSLHICCDCLHYIEHPLLWFQDYRFYPYCTRCIRAYVQMDKIDYFQSNVPKRIYACHRGYGTRT